MTQYGMRRPPTRPHAVSLESALLLPGSKRAARKQELQCCFVEGSASVWKCQEGAEKTKIEQEGEGLLRAAGRMRCVSGDLSAVGWSSGAAWVLPAEIEASQTQRRRSRVCTCSAYRHDD